MVGGYMEKLEKPQKLLKLGGGRLHGYGHLLGTIRYVHQLMIRFQPHTAQLLASLPDQHYYHNIYAVMHHAEIYTTFLFTAPNRHFM